MKYFTSRIIPSPMAMPPHPAHHHPAPPPVHHHRHSLVSVQYDSGVMQQVFGDFWPYHAEKLAPEPPEIKIIFALSMGFTLVANQQMAQAVVDSCMEEPQHDFPNPAICEDMLADLSQRLAIDKELVQAILSTTPPGVVAVIASMLDR